MPRCSRPEVFLGKGVLKIYSKFSEHLFLRTPLDGYFCMSLSHHHLLLNNAYLEGGSLDSCRSTISTSYEDLAIQIIYIQIYYFLAFLW